VLFYLFWTAFPRSVLWQCQRWRW